MGSVSVNEHAVRIIVVIRIPTDMVALVHNQTTLAQLSRQALGHGETGKTRAYDEKVEHLFSAADGIKLLPMLVICRSILRR